MYIKKFKFFKNNCNINTPLNKKNPNGIQDYSFEIFRVTFIVEHTI